MSRDEAVTVNHSKMSTKKRKILTEDIEKTEITEEIESDNKSKNENEINIEREDENEINIEREDENKTKIVTPIPRLMIIKMVLNNFKSYAGKKIIGPFHKRFSSVVGPNGSGKSNVIDALLFVFGKRAKQIRLNKVSELIYRMNNYSAETASVSVYFQEIIDKEDSEDAFEVVQGSQFVVTRTAHKNNTSKYYLNDKSVSQNDIITLLKKKGVDLDHNRFLILQGEVESIALMKPKSQNPNEIGLLEYLEDMIGTNVYMEPINEAGQRIEVCNETRQEQLNRVKVVVKDKDALEEAKNEAVEYLQKDKQLNINHIHLSQYKLHDIKKKLGPFEKKMNETQKKLNEKQNEIKKKEEKLQELNTDFEIIKNEHDTINNECEKCRTDFADFEGKDIELREKLKHLKSIEKKLENIIKKEEKKVVKLREDVLEYEKQFPSLEKKTDKTTAQKQIAEKELDEIFSGIKDKTEPLRIEMEEKQKQLAPLKRKQNNAEQKKNIILSELEALQDKTKNTEATILKNKQEIQESEGQIKMKEKALKVAEINFEKAKNSVKELEEQLDELTNRESKQHSRVSELRSTIAEASASMNASKGLNSVVSGLMRAKKEGKLKGIFGRLGSLGFIESKFDIAISTACTALDAMVVEKTENAQRAIEFLRQKKLGRATFIVLNEMEQYKKAMNREISPPEEAKRLFDLVRPKDERFLPAFYYALRDTLVAENLTKATKWAFSGGSRWRVVTLTGQLIDISGAMSGGGTKVERGRMSSKEIKSDEISEHEIISMKQEYEKLSESLQTLRLSKKDIEGKLKKCNQEHTQYHINFTKAKAEITNVYESLDILKKQTGGIQIGLSKEEEKEVDHLKQKLKLAEEEVKKVSYDTISLENETKSISDRILDAGGSQLRSKKAKVDELINETDESVRAMTKLTVDISTARRGVIKGQNTLEKTKKQHEKNQSEIEQLKTEMTNLERDAKAVMEAYQSAQKVKESKSKIFKTKQKEHESNRKIIDGLKTSEIDLAHKVEEIQKETQEMDKKMKQYKLKLEDYILKVNQVIINLKEEGEYTIEDIDELTLDKNELEQSIMNLENELSKIKPNLSSIESYNEKEKEFNSRAQELQKITDERDNAIKSCADLKKKRFDEFMTGFHQITMKLKEMYRTLTLGGDAELELVDSLDPFSEGVVFSVRPLRKSWKNISMLSGGEKTLSSLALVFALHHYKPTPLYVMDEIDAALDFRNVSIVANYIKERTKNGQFVIISLRNNMFEIADRLVGIYKTDNKSHSITINPNCFENS